MFTENSQAIFISAFLAGLVAGFLLFYLLSAISARFRISMDSKWLHWWREDGRGRRRTDRGFTLIEVALVVLIGGILLGAASSGLLIYVKQTAIKTTEHRLAAVDEAIQQFLSLNGRLPCAAPLTEPPDTAAFGREVTDQCDTGSFPGTQSTGGVRIGAVPVRTINLPDDYAIDAWGNRLTYAVTEILASPNTYDPDMGAISVEDSNGNSAITPAGSAHYVLVSHGVDGNGAYTVQGVQGPTCPGATLDAENCNGNNTFRRSGLRSDTGDAAHFDDLVTARAVSAFGEAMPPGAVMAFNLVACPPGWVEFTPAVGRFIAGAGDYTESYNPGGRPAWSFSQTYALGDTGGYATWRVDDAELGLSFTAPEGTGFSGSYEIAHRPSATDPLPMENRPPYIALLYCQKT
jgi:prepilin-type N-terminal cleavage/methylation domain-containing protein|tara:strand:+ start:1847 stop:3061 length:1215 start_codon:yes stop_codon:yes gene_type:complete